MILYFTYKSGDTLKSFSFVSQCQNYHDTEPEMGETFEKEIKKLAVAVHVLQTTQNLVISHCCFPEDGKEMYHEL